VAEGEHLARAVVDFPAQAPDYLVDVRAGRHTFGVDEGPAQGGAGAAPSPFQLLLSSLGACTAITLRMYAVRKDWDLGDVNVALRYLEAEDGTRYIERTIRVSGELTGEQRDRLAEIAGKTPVTKALSGGARITTAMA
jgi:putative redox protein